MNFHSVSFAVFLLATLSLFWITWRRRNLRSAILLVASYVFYGSWHPWYLSLLVFSTLLDYACGKILVASDDPRKRKLTLLVSLVGNLGMLCFFKFYGWGIESMRAVQSYLGADVPVEAIGIVVPVGISFYTFQTLSYTIDVYRRRIEPARNLLDFALFVSFFPQLVAGPIVRASEFLPQLEWEPRFDRARLHDGLYRIAQGLGKKVLIADVLGRFLVDPVYGNPTGYDAASHAIALYAFTFQIYFDFSGYSDCAIGAARLFGFDLPENFDLPYRSRSAREFWRRWHLTLSYWIRDYIYFPLGGSRRGERRTTFNLMFIMLIMGLWHGATYLWVIYGILHGVALVVERWFERRRGGEPFVKGPLTNLVAWVWTFHFLVVTMIVVRGTSLGNVAEMLSVTGAGTTLTSTWGLVALAVAFASHFSPGDYHGWLHRRALAVSTPALGAAVGLVLGFVALVVVGETPYIYFQF